MSDTLGVPEDETPLIGSRTLHRQTKEVLDRVERGETVVVLRRGRPAAALVPIDEERARALLLASSPQLRARRAANSLGPPAEGEPFAVAAREIGEDDDALSLDEGQARTRDELMTIAREANDLLRLTTEGLERSDEQTRARYLYLDTSVLANLLAIQRRSVHVLADMVHGLREEPDVRDTPPQPHETAGGEPLGGMGANASAT